MMTGDFVSDHTGCVYQVLKPDIGGMALVSIWIPISRLTPLPENFSWHEVVKKRGMYIETNQQT